MIIGEANMIPNIWIDDIINRKPGIVDWTIPQVKIQTIDVTPVGMEV